MDLTPCEGLWSLRQVAVHIASSEDGWFRFVVEGKYKSWDESGIKQASYPTVAAVKQVLAAVHARTKTFLKSISYDDLDRLVLLPWGGETTLDWVIWHVIEHEIHHRGEIFLMLGLQGLEGPDI